MNTTDTTELDALLDKYFNTTGEGWSGNGKIAIQALIERQVLQGSIDTIDKLMKELTGRVVHPNDFAAVSSNLLWEKTQLQGQLNKLTETTE